MYACICSALNGTVAIILMTIAGLKVNCSLSTSVSYWSLCGSTIFSSPDTPADDALMLCRNTASSGGRWPERWTDNCSTNKASCCWSPFLHTSSFQRPKQEVVAALREDATTQSTSSSAIRPDAIQRLLTLYRRQHSAKDRFTYYIGQSENCVAWNYRQS